MNAPAVAARALFQHRYGATPALLVQAPGRVNLIGEHTDYNDGFVLPCAIDRGTVVAASSRGDGQVRVLSADYPSAVASFGVEAPYAPAEATPWADYVRAMVCAMSEAGLPLDGADLAIAGDLPQGAGLSSSASLQVAVGFAMAQLAGLEVSRPQIARFAQTAENLYVGCRCGIMDQLASAEGRGGSALLIDCRSLDVTPIPAPPEVVVTIVHSGVERGLVEGAYNERRAQCEAAARVLNVAALRDVEMPALLAAEKEMDSVVFRRARHVVTENARTLEAAHALRGADLRRLGELMRASHASMRDDFAITVAPVDRLAALIDAAIGGEGGARMTGGGFGGAVVAVSDAAGAARVRSAVEASYRTPKGEAPLILEARPSGGVSRIAA